MRKTRAKTPKGILKAAARLIRERGWCQGAWEKEGKIDLGRAINMCAPLSLDHGTPGDDYWPSVDRRYNAHKELRHRLGVDNMADMGYVSRWNDLPTRTLDDVLRVLEQ